MRALLPRHAFQILAITAALATNNAIAQSDTAPAETIKASATEEKLTLPALPESNDAATISAYLDKINSIRPRTQSREGVIEFVGALIERVDGLLERPLEGEAALNTIGFRHSLYSLSSQLGDQTALAQRSEWVKGLLADDRDAFSMAGRGFEILDAMRSQQIATGDEEAWKEVFDKTVAFLKDTEISPFAATVAMQVSESSEMAAPQAIAAAGLDSFAKLFAESDNENIRAAARQLEGIGRKLNLPGNEMIVTGTTLAGKDFDISSLKGKVVVVDFWATWCPICIESFPELETLYAKHREAGLEIVGVNIDDTKQLWTEYLETRPLPWMHVQNLGTSELDRHPNADRYGINGIPFVVLIGRDGKVIRTNVHPEELKTLIPEALKNSAS